MSKGICVIFINVVMPFLFVAGLIVTNAQAEGTSDVIYAENKTVNSGQSGNTLHGGPKTEIPLGMEVIYISGARYVVPKGAKVNKEYGYNQVESITLYAARRFEELEKRIESLEEKVKQLEEELEGIKKSKSQEQDAE